MSLKRDILLHKAFSLVTSYTYRTVVEPAVIVTWVYLTVLDYSVFVQLRSLKDKLVNADWAARPFRFIDCMWIYSGTALTVSWSTVKMSGAKWVMAQLWALHHPPLIRVVSSVILPRCSPFSTSPDAAFGIPYRLLLIRLKRDSLPVKYTPLNVNFMPSSTGPVRACEILLHHCPSFYHKLGNSAVCLFVFPLRLPFFHAWARADTLKSWQHRLK